MVQTVVLFEMTLDEARLVRDLMNFVGGPEKTTRRGLADGIRRRLTPVLGESPCPMPDMKGAVYCTDAKRTLSIFERDKLAEIEKAKEDGCGDPDCAECQGECPTCGPGYYGNCEEIK